ncbi:MAG: HEPN domain-containing protein [Candidatus Odinarchaeum yellowstonii]|uniref:HEPN domain-containing protein n=1 Tax=Odinarchaeota yellowstonii (strain LCB_4) TaxID=1841599 RepID=A0AAF0IBG0_ODILC|nr:MAG: HEPN domain-containing protein [Candidatus Odinarchaeum yellowstonii]
MGEKENRLKIALEHIKRAERTLEAANNLLKTGLYEDSVTRAYYTAFHAAAGLLYLLGEEPKAYKGLHSIFGLKAVRTGMVEEKLGRYLNKLSSYRESADYDGLTFISGEDAEESIKMAEESLQKIKDLIKNKFSI